jgi:hypothetical protein
MKKKGRPVLGAVAGFFFGVALSVLLLIFGVLPLDSIVVVVIPIVGLLIGVALGLTTPRGGAAAVEEAAPASS